MLFSSNYKTLPVLVLVILFFGLAAFFNLSSGSFLQAATSPDAIAFRVMPNPDHLSPRRWYQDNIKLKGAPQGLTVDGYEAVRDGRTVYVNAANINLDSNIFYSNIYIISYNQQAENATVDIFSQILAHWKFNTNIPDPGICNRTIAKTCLNSSECPTGEYCLSKKANIVRDTKRLADLNDIKEALEKYNSQHGFYPKLAAGSYLANKTISTWPSWQASLGKELGLVLPIDPINKLGVCDPDTEVNKLYDPVTCWNQTSKKFADPSDNGVFNLPADSHVFLYETNANGSSYSACSVMQSGLLTPQNSRSACADSANSTSISISGQNPNHSPIINGANLNGVPNKEFIGWIGVSDPDNDTLGYSIKLIEPASNLWETNYSWRLAAGAEKFVFRPSKVLGQIIIYVAQAGKAGIYKIEFTVDDGQGQPNSKVSQIFDLRIGPIPMTLTSPIMGEVIEIGTSKNYTLTGTDNSGNPLTELKLRSFTFDGSSISSALLGSHGFSLSGMKLFEANASAQKTGTYVINVYAEDLTTHKQIDSSLEITVLNHPPVINSIIATYANGTTQTGSSFMIDNGENATVKVTATDTPGHNVKYELVDNTIGLIINRDSGEITGLSALNSQVSADKIYTGIKVKAFDQYCAASPSNPDKCSVTESFDLTVKEYCSLSKLPLSIPLPRKSVALSTSIITANSGQNIIWGDGLKDYSEVRNGLVDVTYKGAARNSAIVFVLDLSATMGNGTGENRPIKKLQSALIVSTDPDPIVDNSVFGQLYKIGLKLKESGLSLKVGLLGYNNKSLAIYNSSGQIVQPTLEGIYPYPDYNKSYYYTANLPTSPRYSLAKITDSGELNKIKTEVESYAAIGGTNTLAALNEAEKMLGTITGDVDKYVVLMSDGIPEVPFSAFSDGACYCICGTNASGACKPNVTVTCDAGCWSSCGDCMCPSAGTNPGTGTGGTSGIYFNNNSWLKIIFDSIFGLKPALAITTQQQCISTNTCGASCPSNQTRQCSASSDDHCNISDDVTRQARAMKDINKIKFYSIYYDTGGGSGPEQNMRLWSSNDANNNFYFSSGDDISQMFKKVLNTIVDKPRNVVIGGDIIVTDHSLTDPVSTETVNFGSTFQCDSALRCGQMTGLSVNFSGSGYLEFSNLKFDYCPAKLHP